ncbi:hypothetical protein [Streptomyces sp. BA2]|uniref:hypothetical protein n=1 Tax=Streptomyces sp. BA2 TaxID=436595 RepID=UPI0013251885|nr:hypothetical protein [Streptomyces sp. BA2]MWA13143.1 hypothetical protein [Streptomyces sp. BA2]
MSRKAAALGSLLAAALLLSGCGESDDGGSGRGGSGADGGSESSAVEAKLLGQVPMAKVGEMSGAMGMWTTDKNFVKADLKKIVGYSLDGAKAEWQIPLAGEICWSSPEPTEAGLVAVLFQDSRKDPSVCTEVGLVDLNKGKLLWQKQAVDEYGSPQMFDEVTIGGGTVAAAGTSADAGWKVSGEPLWKPSDDKCPVEGYAGSDEKLIALRDCGEVETPQLTLQTIAPATRAVKSAYELPAGTEYAHVVSTDPLVVAADGGDSKKGSSGASEFLTVDDSGARGKLLSTISTVGGKYGKYRLDCPATEVSGCRQIAVTNDTLFLGTSEPGSPSSEAENDLVALDLRTGKPSGRAEGVEGGPLTPIGVADDGKVIAYQEADVVDEAGGAVWALDPKTYKKTKLQQNPSSTYEMEARFTTERRMLFAGDRLYIGGEHVTAPSTVFKKKQPLAAVFGAK